MLLSKKIIKDQRNSLYFRQFRYVATFYLKEASALRKLDHNVIDERVEFRNQWRFQINEDQRQRLHKACDCILSLAHPYKLTISHNWIYFYTNELKDIDALALGSPMTRQGTIKEAVITHAPDVVGLKNPQHLYRTYIRSHRPETQQRENLESFLQNNREEIRISPGLADFIKDKRRLWLNDGYFIDHNDMRMVTALALVSPKLVRKTLPIVMI